MIDVRHLFLAILFQVIFIGSIVAQIIPVNSGSYTETFPGTDAARVPGPAADPDSR